MSDDKLSFLNRDDKGRFAPKEGAEPEAKPVEAAPTPAPEVKPAEVKADQPPAPTPAIEPPKTEVKPEPLHVPPGYVPLAGQLDEREKRQAAVREAEEWKRKYEDATRKQIELDPVSDPDGFRAHYDRQIAQARFDAIAQTSHMVATGSYGAETVKAAEEWLGEECKRNPGFFQTIERQPHPYDFVVKAYKRDQMMTKIGDKDLDAWAEEWAKAKGYSLQPASNGNAAAPSPAPATPTPLPRPSIASAPAAASGATPRVPTGPGTAFDGVFAK